MYEIAKIIKLILGTHLFINQINNEYDLNDNKLIVILFRYIVIIDTLLFYFRIRIIIQEYIVFI